MAFAKMQDYDGEFDMTFFPKTWETLKNQIQDGNIYAFKGKVDGSREEPSFIVDSLEDISTLKQHSIHEVHISLENNFNSERDIAKMKDFLFGTTGNCSVYFHVDTLNGAYIVKANSSLTCPATPEVLTKIKDLDFVKEVWSE